MQNWRYAFCSQVFNKKGRWKLGNYEWHAFSAGYVELQRGQAAEKWFQEQTDTSYYVFQEMIRRFPFLRIENAALPQVEWCRQRDMIIFPVTYDWTMVFTHEDGSLADNPYFAMREWQDATLYDCVKAQGLEM